VDPGEGAQKAGLLAGDTIKEINGKPINSAKDIANSLTHFQPGKKVRVTWVNSGGLDRHTATVTLSEGPAR
jgi:S1-C subfamily serine protease